MDALRSEISHIKSWRFAALQNTIAYEMTFGHTNGSLMSCIYKSTYALPTVREAISSEAHIKFRDLNR